MDEGGKEVGKEEEEVGKEVLFLASVRTFLQPLHSSSTRNFFFGGR